MSNQALWKRYQDYFCHIPSLGFSIDISRMKFPDNFMERMDGGIRAAYDQMDQLEKGGIANPDEKRMVGHYWLRNPSLAPNAAIREEIESTLKAMKDFAHKIHHGTIVPEKADQFTQLLVIGIGGSALGPQLVNHALGDPFGDKMKVWFFDNSDPDGMDYVLGQIENASEEGIAATLTVVVSKSGGTKETRNGQLEAKAAYKKAGLDFSKHFVAVTGKGSELSQTAENEKWLAEFPMWDWVGGRTSELSAVGLLPAALQGIDIDAMLEGASLMDVATRTRDTLKNPSALLALMWYHATGGKGLKDMVVLPYKDRLLLFSRYLQQLLMESLGKEFDLKGNVVNQGIAVYGNKGSTDQHAYVQQLREGVPNFFVTFIEVLQDRLGSPFEVEKGITSGDYLGGFLQGTRQALYEKDRESITITVPDVSPKTLGGLIAVYERAVGYYASLVGINAYHQPGVEAGKKAAGAVLEVQRMVQSHLSANHGKSYTADALARELGIIERAEMIYLILRHLAADANRHIRMEGIHPGQATFRVVHKH